MFVQVSFVSVMWVLHHHGLAQLLLDCRKELAIRLTDWPFPSPAISFNSKTFSNAAFTYLLTYLLTSALTLPYFENLWQCRTFKVEGVLHRAVFGLLDVLLLDLEHTCMTSMASRTSMVSMVSITSMASMATMTSMASMICCEYASFASRLGACMWRYKAGMAAQGRVCVWRGKQGRAGWHTLVACRTCHMACVSYLSLAILVIKG